MPASEGDSSIIILLIEKKEVQKGRFTSKLNASLNL